MPNLTPGGTYTVRLHFAEIYWNAPGKRLFNVSINGTRVLTNFDIFATARGEYKAIVERFTTTADSSGRITIQYTTVRDNAKSSGIEIISGIVPGPTVSGHAAPSSHDGAGPSPLSRGVHAGWFNGGPAPTSSDVSPIVPNFAQSIQEVGVMTSWLESHSRKPREIWMDDFLEQWQL